jgi:peptidoglycan/LPS O-acetylase OafA/YrhL
MSIGYVLEYPYGPKMKREAPQISKKLIRVDPSDITRVSYLDGLRGVAACMVFFGHLILAVFPGMVTFERHQLHSSAEIALGVSPLSWLWKGSFAVCIFFVLSGYVLAGFCESTRLSVPAQILRRYLRLALPMLITSTFAWALMVFGLYRNVETASQVTHSDWLAMWYHGFEPNFVVMAKEAVFDAFRNGRADYNPNLWTMRIELVGSVAIFIGYALFRNIIIRLIAILLVLTWNYDSYYCLFAFGVLFRNLQDPFGRLLNDVISSANGKEWLMSAVLILGLYLGAYSHTPADIVGTWHFFFPKSLPTTAYHMMGAVLVVGALLYCTWLQRWLAGRLGRFLGRLSFVLYLVHLPIICSVTAWSMLLLQHLPYGANALIAMLLTTAAVFGLSTWVYWYVDVYTTSLSRYAGKKLDNWLPERGTSIDTARPTQILPVTRTHAVRTGSDT